MVTDPYFAKIGIISLFNFICFLMQFDELVTWPKSFEASESLVKRSIGYLYINTYFADKKDAYKLIKKF